MAKRILYIQHATAMGGSVLSLLYLIQKLDRDRYTPVIACLGTGGCVPEFYREHGIETLLCPALSIFPHTTGGWFPLHNPRAFFQLAMTLFRFPGSIRATRRLLREIKPDLVHLNSVVLVPSAIGAAREGLPVVWHVREAVVRGHLGLRRFLIRRWLDRIPTEVVFISSEERNRTFRDCKGIYIPNFVDFKRFDRTLDGTACRQELDLAVDDQIVLFLGGLSEIKGIHPFLEAMRIERARNPRIRALIGMGISASSVSWIARLARIVLPLVGSPTTRQRVMAFLERNQMSGYVHLLPFRRDVELLIAASDLLVFPSTAPHFGRPVIEAGAMGKPVVGSRIGGVEELVEDGETGLLVQPGDAAALADALHRVLMDPNEAKRMGTCGHARAYRLYNADVNAEETIAIYDRIFQNPEASRVLDRVPVF
ncbi:MAG: glycosyltransferase family 1 protein [Myxococcales bacterium]|nr:MAG: glycosyltransferase family 1 protein [Myxococcales bacterium]